MKTLLPLRSVLGLFALASLIAPKSFADEPKPVKPLGKIERIDPKFDELVPKDAVVETLAGGFNWSEGPVWFPEDGGYLLFSDVPENVVFRWDEKNGVKEFLKPSGYTGTTPRSGEPGSNGLLRSPDGSLVLMQHGDRRVAKLAKDGSFVTLADSYEGKRFNSPNDGVFSSKGDLFFTDPPYGLEKGVEDPKRELDFQGVYRLSKEGKLSLATKELSRPNGIALSPDEKILYVANSDPDKAVWMAYPLKDDGTVAKQGKPGLPDGMKVDAKGNVFATGPGGVFVFTSDGTHLGTFVTGFPDGNCAWGDDGSTLYIMADMFIGRVKLNTKGKGF
jgi:gluconolactonase